MKKEGVFTPADLARKLKVKPQTAHKWWSGATKKIAAEDLFKICDGLKVSARWLLFGKGSMAQYVNISPEEREVLDLFNALPDDWRDDWVGAGRRTLDRLTEKPSQMVPYPPRK